MLFLNFLINLLIVSVDPFIEKNEYDIPTWLIGLLMGIIIFLLLFILFLLFYVSHLQRIISANSSGLNEKTKK